MSADMIAITYDWKSAVARAESNGRPDWANGLRQGGSWPIPAGNSSPPPLEPKGTLMCARFVSSHGVRNDLLPRLLRLPANTADADQSHRRDRS